MFRTINTSTWALHLENLFLEKNSVIDQDNVGNKNVIFNPQYPYLYLPYNDFDSFKSELVKLKVNDKLIF